MARLTVVIDDQPLLLRQAIDNTAIELMSQH